MTQKTYIPRMGEDADFGNLTAATLTVGGNAVSMTSVLLGAGQVVDLNGENDALVLDADADTTISAPTDNQIDVEIAGADDFRFTANLFEALSGSLMKGELRQAVQTLTATGAITLRCGLVILSHATVVIAATLVAPTAGDMLIITNGSASGTVAHTVTLSGVTWNGTNSVATLDAPGEALLVIALSATRFLVLSNIGSVAFS